MTKSKPQRKCLGCNEMKDKQSLLRVVRDDTHVFIDRTGKANGRGAYICADVGCFNKAVKQKRFEKAFKCALPQELFESLAKQIGEDGNK